MGSFAREMGVCGWELGFRAVVGFRTDYPN